MRNYRGNADSQTRIDYGNELVPGLNLFAETKEMAPPVVSVTDDLDAAQTLRLGKHKPLIQARAAVRFGNWVVDMAIRAMHHGVSIVEGGKAGPLTKGLFPDGLTPVIAPGGKRQIKPTEDLIERTEKSKLAGAEKVRTGWLPPVKEALAVLTAAAKAYDGALEVEVGAFRSEVALRDEHRLTIDKVIGLVRAAFPGDRAKQDVIFPEVAGTDGGEGGDGGAEPATPGAGPGPKPGPGA